MPSDWTIIGCGRKMQLQQIEHIVAISSISGSFSWALAAKCGGVERKAQSPRRRVFGPYVSNCISTACTHKKKETEGNTFTRLARLVSKFLASVKKMQIGKYVFICFCGIWDRRRRLWSTCVCLMQNIGRKCDFHPGRQG